MARGKYTSIGGERGGGERGERGEWGERGRHHRWHGEWGERGWRGHGWGGWGGPYRSIWPYGYSYAVPSYAYTYAYARPAFDISDSGYVYPTGQLYAPSYYSYAVPSYDRGALFPHWRSRRHFLNRHRRRVHYILGRDVD